jgi:hypothetical protein
MPTPSSTKLHQRWLRRQLAYANINHNRLLGLTILLERVVRAEQERLLHRIVPLPFYNLQNGKGTESKAWIYAAEAALWLDYKGYPAYDWFTAICRWSPIRRRLLFGQQIPMSFLCPTARLGMERMREMEKFYLFWKEHHE